MHTVIVGGGFAGIKTALELSKASIGKVTLISDRPYFLHHSSLYATAIDRSKDASVISLADIFAKHHDVSIVEDTITSVDPARHLVVSKKKSYSYDNLVLALGSHNLYLNGNKAVKKGSSVNTLEEALKFQAKLQKEIKSTQPTKLYTIIGGGTTGVELAGALSTYVAGYTKKQANARPPIKVRLVEAHERILPDMSITASRVVSKRLNHLGVEVLTGQRITPLDDTYITIDGQKTKASSVIWTSGFINNTFFNQHDHYFDIESNGLVNVDPFLQAYPHIYVIGDNANVKGAGYARSAIAMGTYLARHLVKKETHTFTHGYRPYMPTLSLSIGDDWGYVEKYGVYASGSVGAYLQRQIELKTYRQLASANLARSAWSAHNEKVSK